MSDKEEWKPETCRTHPQYKAIHKPRVDCPQCWLLYKLAHKGKET